MAARFTVIFLLWGVVASAQKVGFEFNAGIVASKIKASDLIISGEPKARFSLTTNFLLHVPVTGFLGMQTGIGFSCRGTKLEHGFYPFIPSGTSTVKMNYIEFPFLIWLGSEKFHLLAGPQLSLLVKSDFNGIKKDEFGMRYGLGYNPDRLAFKLLFYNSLSEMIDYPGNYMENRNTSFTVGWMLQAAESRKKNKDAIHRIVD